MSLPADRSPQVVVFLGGPASGKGTQASQLAAALGVPHISSGELLRARCSTDSRMERGDLVPDDVVTDKVLVRLAQPDARRGVVLDGFPRTLNQAKALDAWLDRQRGAIAAAFYLDVPREVMVDRAINRGRISHRNDDLAEVAERRVDVFLREIAPLLEHYDSKGVLHRLDGTGSVDEIQQRIIRALGLPAPPAH